MTQSVCLAMIVRDEAHVIRRCLESIRPYITHWAIVDTGSKDGTQAIIREVLGDLPGELIERPWRDFSTNRNQSLDLARSLGAEYALVIDADETFHKVVEGAEFGPFTDDSCSIRLRMADSENIWCRRQLFRLALSWHYEEEIHERSVCDEAVTAGGIIGFEIRSFNDSARNKDGLQKKAKRDAKTLKRMLKSRPNDPRLVYYLAQTVMNSGDIDGAIKLHEKRLGLGGFGEELYMSAQQIAGLMEFRGDHWEDVARAWLRAYNIRPTRAEPLWALAVLHNDQNMPAVAEIYARAACRIPRPTDALIVNESVYKYRCADELAGALSRLGRYDEARKILLRLVEFPELPPAELPRIQQNLGTVEKELAAA